MRFQHSISKLTHYCLLCVSVSLWFIFSTTSAAGADLPDYIKKPEPKFGWKLRDKTTSPVGTIYDLELVSQEWHDILWKHQLQVYQAPETEPNATMLLWNTGGSANVGTIAFGLSMSAKVRAPVAILYGIPNQPLLGGKKKTR